jgi:hypothetical protein
MREPYEKGVATHLDPESCAGNREAAGEALTGDGAADKAASLMGWKSPAVSCPNRTASISDAREGNDSCPART